MSPKLTALKLQKETSRLYGLSAASVNNLVTESEHNLCCIFGSH